MKSIFSSLIDSFRIKEQEQLDSENIFDKHPISDTLPYETYDEENRIFFNKNSMGFVLEMIPIVGSDETTQKELSGIFDDILTEGDSVQFLLLADNKTEKFFEHWRSARLGRQEIYHELAKKRSDYLQGKTRIFRVIVSYSRSFKGQVSDQDIDNVVKKKQKLLKTLQMLSYAFEWNAQDLLDNLANIVNFTLKPSKERIDWNEYQNLSESFVSGGKLEIQEDHLTWKNQDTIKFKSYRTAGFPDHWSMAGMDKFLGDAFRESLRIKSPFYIHYGVHIPNQDTEGSKFYKKSSMIEKQGSSSSLVRMIPDLAQELKECDAVRRLNHNGARFVWTNLSFGIWSEESTFSDNEQVLKSLARINQFRIIEDKCIHLPSFLSALPMTWGEFVPNLKRLNLLKTTLSTECTNFLPIQGEWHGTATPGVLLQGRRGQVTNWNPFDNKGGNYNTIVVGRSGSGKSVFMQEILCSGLSTGAKVFAIDVGRSFEKLATILDAQQITFEKESKICLNPFSNIQFTDPEDADIAFSFLKPIISCMACPTEETTDYQNALVEKAIKYAWEKKQTKATITDVSEWLVSQEDTVARHLGITLTPYTKSGTYGRYFEGTNNVNFNNQMVLIELEELKERKDLQAVVLQILIMNIATQAFMGDRKTPFYICIDEAWDLLRSPQSGIFIETLARRLRKYRGSLVIGTQDINDFFGGNPGARAAFDNSDWMCILAQKKEGLKKLSTSDHFYIDDDKRKALESVQTVQGEYSDIMISDADGNYSICRSILDPFSSLLYTTKAEEYSEIKELQNHGLSITEAINSVIEGKQK